MSEATCYAVLFFMDDKWQVWSMHNDKARAQAALENCWKNPAVTSVMIMEPCEEE